MTLRMIIEGVDNGYLITVYKPDQPGLPAEAKRVAIDASDLFLNLAKVLDYDLAELVHHVAIPGLTPIKHPSGITTFRDDS